MPEEKEEAFDTDTKMMATFNKENGNYRIAIKGAPEAVINASSKYFADGDSKKLEEEKRKEIIGINELMAKEGLRVLGFASRSADSLEVNPYENITFLGLVGLLDPPRIEVKDSIQLCRNAGIKVIMVTGDQAATAANIAKSVGLTDQKDEDIYYGNKLEDNNELTDEERQKIENSLVFARVTPKQKLTLISIHQKAGKVVAMTGDGVNDAPALKKADIGIAMGKRGTQVAKEAADMILKDDAFSSIVAAVEQGRIIFKNIRKFVLYLLSCNISEILSVAGASLINSPLPVLPMQILFLNLVTDIFPALALGVGEGDENIMKQKPRSYNEPILTRNNWFFIGGYGIIISLSVIGAFETASNIFDIEQKRAVTISFLTLALSQLWHVFNMRSGEEKIFNNEITQNKFIWGALLLCIVLVLGAVYIPSLARIIKVSPPDLTGWGIVIVFSLIPLILGQVFKILNVDTN